MAKKVLGIEALDHPSDGQLLAFAKQYFRRVDALAATSDREMVARQRHRTTMPPICGIPLRAHRAHLVSFVLTAAMFGACGGRNDDSASTDPDPTDPPASATTAATDAPGTTEAAPETTADTTVPATTASESTVRRRRTCPP
ncbi:MAG: hypothetical protein R2713_01160 [Ilumatobacteraceae bacterium]